MLFHDRKTRHDFEISTATGVKYEDAIPKWYVHIYKGAVSSYFILMDDNERRLRDHPIKDIIKCEDICRMDWSARFPDLKFIYNI